MTGTTRTWLFLGLAALALPVAGCGSNCADSRFATVAWSIEDLSGNPLTCQQVPANEVILNFGNFGPYSFPCTAYTGSTPAGLPPGDYDFSMQLLAPDGSVLSDTAVANPPVSYPIYNCAQDDIPDVIFSVQ